MCGLVSSLPPCRLNENMRLRVVSSRLISPFEALAAWRRATNRCTSAVVIDAIRAHTDVPLNIHLMIQEPENLLSPFAKVESDQILVHAEACGHLHRTVSRIKDKGNQVGVAINPGTAISAVEDVLPLLDMVMVMAVNPGASGQSFIPQSLDKIRRLKGIIDEGKYAAQIEVDGGIKADWTAQDSIKAGATILVAGSAIFNDRESIPDAMKGMRGCILG